MPPLVSAPDPANISSGSPEPGSAAAPGSEFGAGRAIIVGAGPAGLTAAIELLRHTGVKPVVLEASHEIGGISRTVRYKGNRMDIGGHRFFSKSNRVMNWWLEMMPVAAGGGADNAGKGVLQYQGKRRDVPESELSRDAETEDLVMLVRQRKSRIYFLRRFFDYPIKMSADTFRNLGLVRTMRCGFSYLRTTVMPKREEKTLEDFIINRFGRELYLTFFKSYTEKVWGTPCHLISAEWGAQRIKGLSLTTAVKHFLRQRFKKNKAKTAHHDHRDIAQKKIDTSLIERFLYPKFGPGQLWEHVAEQVLQMGGEIHLGWTVDKLITRSADPAHHEGRGITAVEVVNAAGERRRFAGDVFLSTMPIKELTHALDNGGAKIPHNVREVSNGLEYRDFITVGLLVDRLAVHEPDGGLLKDTWIYISVACRSSTTGARTSSKTSRRSGLAWNISAMTRIPCGRCRMTN